MTKAKEFLNSFLMTQTEKIGFSHYGWTTLSQPLSYEFYLQWLKDQKHADMHYLEQQKDLKKSPSLINANLKSGLFFAFPYFPLSENEQDSSLQYSFIAKYARGEDYHQWIIKKLNSIIQTLSEQFPEDYFIAYTDSKPILERDYAYQAGLGWVGKNTCLIHPKHGSYFLIAEILTSLDFSEELKSEPVPFFCGTCTACIDACPTQALTPNKLDANLCLSYWTIESKEAPPATLRSQFGKQFFGCDICQDVCPWNKKNHKANLLLELQKQTQESFTQNIFFREILSSSFRELQNKWAHTPLARARGFGLKRNALLFIGNNNLQELKNDVEVFNKKLQEELQTNKNISDEDKNKSKKTEQLIELAQWCLSQLRENQLKQET